MRLVGDVHGEEAVVRLGGEEEVPARARGPHVESARVERRVVETRDVFRMRGIGDVEDVEPVPHAAALLRTAETLHLRRHHAAAHFPVLGVVSRGAVEVLALQPHAVAVAVQLLVGDLPDIGHVVRVEHRHHARAPVAGVEIAVSVLDALRLVRLAHRDVAGVVGIRHVDELHAVLPLAEETHVACNVHARRELTAVEARADARLRRVGGVDDPESIFARGDVRHALLHGHLACGVDSGHFAKFLRRARVGHVVHVQIRPRAHVETAALKAERHRGLVRVGHLHGRAEHLSGLDDALRVYGAAYAGDYRCKDLLHATNSFLLG